MNTYELPVLTVLKRLCIGYVVLVLISACLYWTIPSNAGLGLALMVGPFPFLIAVLGAIALGVALWNEWLPREGCWVAAGTLVWALVPVIAGLVFAFTVIDGLEAWYASPRFAAWYSARSGITIAAQGQSFHYADCSPDAYMATHTVTAQRDKELAFVLLDRSDLHATDAGPDVAQSIGEQFAFVREAPYYLVDEGGEPGVFRVPASAHTLAVKAQSAFQLGVMDLNPPVTPTTRPATACTTNWRLTSPFMVCRRASTAGRAT